MATAVEPSPPSALCKQASQGSLSGLESVEPGTDLQDVDMVMNKRWTFDEVSELLQRQIAILPGGRDKNGGPIVVIEGLDHLEYRMLTVGKILSYLSKIPGESVQGHGFTILLDMRQTSWVQMKRVLNILKITFVEHIYQVIVMRPKSFWQRQRTGMSLNMKKNKYRFKFVLLEHSGDLFQHLSPSQVPKTQNGQLDYLHSTWMETQKTLEHYLLELLAQRDNYSTLADLLEYREDPSNLPMAKEAVRRHVDLRQRLNRTGLDSLSESVTHTIGKLRLDNQNPDFESSCQHLEELCTLLQETLIQLERQWDDKGARLDSVLQFRVFEHDAEQHLTKLRDKISTFSREMTSIGSSAATALQNKRNVEEFRNSVLATFQDINRVLKMGDRLLELHHPSKEMISERSSEISSVREKLKDMMEERVALVSLSASFHEKQDTFLAHSQAWVDECASLEQPADIPAVEENLERHKQLKNRYNEMYSGAREDGHNLIGKLRRPVGEGSVPSDFIIGSRHIKELLENMYDEKSLIDDQWETRQQLLKQTLNLRVFQRKTQKIFQWINEVGNPFLLANNQIGADMSSAQALLKRHDAFESDTEVPVVYGQSSLLLNQATEMAASRECQPALIEREATMMEEVVNGYAARLDERREIILLAMDCFKSSDTLLQELRSLLVPIPPAKYEGSVLEVETTLSKFRAYHDTVQKLATTTFQMWDSLSEHLGEAAKVSSAAKCPVDYSPALKTIEGKLAGLKLEWKNGNESCVQRETRCKLSLNRVKLLQEMEGHLVQLHAWLQEQSKELEVADSASETRLQLDILERQYNQLCHRHDTLVAQGKDTNAQVQQLDQVMFNGATPGKKAGEQLEQVMTKLVSMRGSLEKEAAPRLRQLRERLLYYSLDQEAQKLDAELKEVSLVTTRLTGIGHALKAAQSLWESAQETSERLEAIGQEIEGYCSSVEECISDGHSQSSLLRTLESDLKKKYSQAKKTLADRQAVIRAAVVFYQNYENLKLTLDKCQAQFSSRESAKTLADIERQQATMSELKQAMLEAVKQAKNHAQGLVPILTGNHVARTAIHAPEENGAGSGPRLLVAPHRVQQNRSSSPSPQTLSDQQVIEEHVQQMDQRVSHLNRLWNSRNTRLEQSKQVIEFEEEVPKLLKWMDEGGAAFLEHRNEYGRSIEEVHKLTRECEEFEKNEVQPIAQRVALLQVMMKQFEEAGHYELNRVRSVGMLLESRWESFDRDVKTRIANLKLSLTFQEGLFQGSNWCMQSEQFLQSMEEKISECDTSEEAAKLRTDLSVYLSVTHTEQTERVSKIKQISSFLHSNLLVDLALQLEESTQLMTRDFDTMTQDLETLYNKLVQIEKEKDREQRLLKQRERVLEELLATEVTYVNDLRVVVEKCIPRFFSDFLPDTLKGKEHIVFSNVRSLEELHREIMLPQLQLADGDVECIAEVFIEQVSTMTELYVPYCQNRTASEEILAKHRTYLNRVQNMFGTDAPISSLLIKPVQRITKYPLLLKDALRYTKQLGQDTSLLELAVQAVEETPIQTNNAIHFSLLEGEDQREFLRLGDLLYQGPLLVSEPRLLISTEKERQVFIFENAILFARRIELNQAKFKYEFKFKLPLTSSVHVIEFFEGEPCKFGMFTSDHRMHLKAGSVEVKQQWVQSLRTAVHSHVTDEARIQVHVRAMSIAPGKQQLMGVDQVARDLREKSPGRQTRSPLPTRRAGSPFSTRRINYQTPVDSPSPTPSAFEIFKATEDYESLGDEQLKISVKSGQKLEVMEQSGSRWFVRATSATGDVQLGFVPSSILEPVPDSERVLEWDQEVTGLTDMTDGEVGRSSVEFRRYTTAASFGSQDIASQKVIRTLRNVTIGEGALPTPPSPLLAHSPKPGRRTNGQLSPDCENPEASTALAPRSPRLSNNRRELHSPVLPSRAPQHTISSPTQTSQHTISPPNAENGVDAEVKPSVVQTGNNRIHKGPSRFKRKVVVRRHSSNKHTSESDPGSSARERSMASSDDDDESQAHSDEAEKEKRAKAEEKIKYIMAELVGTEVEYVTKLETLVEGFLKEMHENPSLPEALKGKERMIFGNAAALYEFHKETFKQMIEEAQDSLEKIAQCFLLQRNSFKLYVTYCENKPKSESWLWTYTHGGGTFFTGIQRKIGVREDIASFLIKPVQRITKYQLLLKDLLKTSVKAGLNVPSLEEAVQLMQDVPKEANDHMALSMIDGYEGNIHANGQIILQDEFMVYEKSRWSGGAKRHIFLLDQRIIITKDKDIDGLYLFKDSLKVHQMTITEKEKQTESSCRFAISTGSIRDPDQYYVLEAASPEKKQQWVSAIKDILSQQFQMLKALKQPNRPLRLASSSPTSSPVEKRQSNPNPHRSLLIDMSDSSLDSLDDEEGSPMVSPRVRTSAMTKSDQQKVQKYPEFTRVESERSLPRQPMLYIVGDDCAPPAGHSGILNIKKGQIYDILNDKGRWWMARLIRDTPDGDGALGAEGWVPGTFMDPYYGELEYADMMFARRKISVEQARKISIKSATLPVTKNEKFDKKSPRSQRRMKQGNPPKFQTQLSDETVLYGHQVQFKCQLDQEYPGMSISWLYDGQPLTNDHAFVSTGVSNVLQIKDVQTSDEGMYMCMVSADNGIMSTSAKLTVLGPPDPPSKPVAKQITSTSVSLSWDPPVFDGHSSITIYLVECRDTVGYRWSTLMKRITEPATIVDDLVSGAEYVFRTIANNNIGSSEPSVESNPIRLVRHTSLRPVFSVESFDDHYTLIQQIAKGTFSVVHECLHKTTQQIYAAKLLPSSVGRDRAQRELNLLCRIYHPNLVQMTAAYLTNKHYIFVLHYIRGISVFEYFCQNELASERVVGQCVLKLLSGLAYLHQQGIVHLSVRPENILVEETHLGELDTKLVHFSSAQTVTKEREVVATPLATDQLEFCSPEILRDQPVSMATDMWAVGVLIYTILGGNPPFLVDSIDLTKENIKQARLTFPSRLFRGVSEDGKDLIGKLLVGDKSDRLCASDCLQHPWFSEDDPSLEALTLDMARLKAYSTRRWQHSLLISRTTK